MLEELKALIKSPKLWVTMIGVALVPALYNLSFLGSMWDPYGSLDNLPVAVVNKDKTATLNDKKLTIGDDMVDSMSINKALDYHFVSQKKADKGLKDGDYYMVITLPEDLSEKASSLLTDNPKKLNIKYQTTAGRSFVASKMSESAMTKLKDTVSENITETYTKAVFKSMSGLQDGLQEASDGGNELLSGSQQLESGSQTITDNLNTAASGSQTLADGTATLSSGLTTYTNGVSSLASGLNTLSDGLLPYTGGVGQLATGLNELSSKFPSYISGVGQIAGVMPQLTQGFTAYANGVSEISLGQTAFTSALTDYTNGVSQLSAGLAQLDAKSRELTDGINQLQTTSNNSLEQLIAGATNLNDGLQTLQTELNNTTLPDASQLQINLDSLSQFGQQLSAMSSAISSINSSDLAAVQATAAYQKLSDTDKAEIDTAITNSTGATTADNLITQISSIQTQLVSLQDLSTQLANLSTLLNNIAALKANVVTASAGSQQLVDGLTQFKEGLTAESGIPTLVSGISDYTTAVAQLTDGANQIVDNNEKLLEASSQLSSGSNELASNSTKISNGLIQVQSGSAQLASYNDELTSGVTQLTDGANQLAVNNDKLLSGASTAASGANQLTASNSQLTSGASQLQSGAEALASGSSQLAAGSGTLTSGLTTLTSGLSTLSSSLTDASKQLSLVSVTNKNAKLVSNPVSTKETDNDNVKVNGIGMAPYMIAVSLMVVALSTNVIFASSLSGRPVKNRFEWAKQKLFINGLISTVGSLVLYGAIQFLGFEANYEWRTIFLIILGGWTLMALVTALVGWDNRYGSFLSLVMLLLQVGSAGGSYPIELSPKFFQVVHPYMPMTYIVTGLRQTISMTGSIGTQVGVLSAFLVAFMVFGLIIYRQPKTGN
ncbi:YhgE/Pip domain-containing protein [Streptococcus lutetiensis]|uniref:YhgE/Pip domain-containing protein n=1 Tax=Streptococcus lutetiensis TaxID=150055 RepID=UPI001BD99C54|nr:YhgE/Pip domain-containing protein [Streptococcus lutetiensis]MBT0892185.1 YhgE/Pip domain-containing protein [Streptococcus lutetiensis]MBT0902893.1 YhgE/Pip domain-containing protein [Streptococcus lutetiensis]